MARTALLPLIMATTLASAAVPTLPEVRQQMAIPSTDAVRGQLDGVGYARTQEAMARVWELAARGPEPESFGQATPAPGIAGLVGPHDDYVYAARVYRRAFPLVTAKTVVLVGVFHKYRRFEARDHLVFDPYRAWRAPDGEIAVSPLRDELFRAMPQGMAVQDAASHDAEHSLEGIAYFLKHARRDVEIVPILVPAAPFERLETLSRELASALAASMRKRAWTLGRDVAIVVSTDGVHYGADFKHEPYGAGGVDAFLTAMAFDRQLVRDTLAGPAEPAKARRFFGTVVDASNPDTYLVPWCGRFSVPLGTMLIAHTAEALGLARPSGVPLWLGVSVDTPELPVRDVGLGPTAPANLHHFVTHPAVAYTIAP